MHIHAQSIVEHDNKVDQAYIRSACCYHKFDHTFTRWNELANLCFEGRDSDHAVFLNRVVSIMGDRSRPQRRVSVEPDSRHAQLLIKELGLQGAKGVGMPMEKRSAEQQFRDWESPPLDAARAKLYRSGTMRVAYLAQDRMDLGEMGNTIEKPQLS